MSRDADGNRVTRRADRVAMTGTVTTIAAEGTSTSRDMTPEEVEAFLNEPAPGD